MEIPEGNQAKGEEEEEEGGTGDHNFRSGSYKSLLNHHLLKMNGK